MFATIVGPYPRPDGLDDEAALRLAIEDQLLADMGVLADGAATPDPDAVAAWRRADAMARSLATELGVEPRPLKARLRGPWTSSAPLEAATTSRRESAMAAAQAGNRALKALFAAGAPMVQVEEDGLTAIGADDEPAHALAIDLFQALMAGVEGHVSLSVVGGDPCGAGPEVLYAAPFSSHLFDLILGPDGWRVARAGAARARPHPRRGRLPHRPSRCRSGLGLGRPLRRLDGRPWPRPHRAGAVGRAGGALAGRGADEAAIGWPRRPPWPASRAMPCAKRSRNGREAEAGGQTSRPRRLRPDPMPGPWPDAVSRAFWRWFFPFLYGFLRLTDPFWRRLTERRGLGNTVELLVVGRRTGRERRVMRRPAGGRRAALPRAMPTPPLPGCATWSTRRGAADRRRGAADQGPRRAHRTRCGSRMPSSAPPRASTPSRSTSPIGWRAPASATMASSCASRRRMAARCRCPGARGWTDDDGDPASGGRARWPPTSGSWATRRAARRSPSTRRPRAWPG